MIIEMKRAHRIRVGQDLDVKGLPRRVERVVGQTIYLRNLTEAGLRLSLNRKSGRMSGKEDGLSKSVEEFLERMGRAGFGCPPF